MSQWNIESPTTEYYDHQTPGIEAVIKEVLDTPEVALDTETTGLVTWKDIPLYWSLAFGNRRMTLNVSALHKFRECFADPTKRWLFANAKFDVHMLANVGVNFAGKLVDTTVMHALLYEERSHGLKDMNLHLFGWQWQDFQDTFGKITKLNTPEMIIRTAEATNFPLLCEYAANDAWGTLQVYRELARQLKGAPTHSLFRHAPLCIETLWDLFDKIEVPYTKVLWHTERNGVLVNQEYLHSISPTAVAEIEDLSKEICKEAGKVINPNSTPQLSEYFFKQKGYTPMKMTKGGKSGIRKASLDESSLTHFSDQGDKMAAMVLRYRSLSKLHGTYIVGLGEKMDPHYRIHTRFNQDVARTGRLSSSDPNMQNIPKPENDKWKLRGAFVAQEGYELIVADYEQLEMRLLACASLEPGMIDVIRKGWDIHMGNASMIFGMPYEEIRAAKAKEKKGGLDSLTPREKECVLARGAAKDIGFGLIYGMGPEKLAASIGVSRPEAEAKIKQFKEAYPAVNAFTIEAVRETEETGYAFTILGRRRNVPEIASHSRVERMRGERIAINTQIQGSAADVVKMAQILLFKSGIDKRFGAFANLQVHDEIMHECPKETSEFAKAEIKDWMEHPFPTDLAVPLSTSINKGHSWLEAK
jgi:DNA polymerase-1